jgi:hypothetical protein
VLFGATTLSTMTLGTMKYSGKWLLMLMLSVFMLSVTIKSILLRVIMLCRYAEHRYAECRYAICRGAFYGTCGMQAVSKSRKIKTKGFNLIQRFFTS